MAIGQDFMRKTRISELEPPDQQRKLPQPPLFADCGGEPVHPLPDPAGRALPPSDFIALVNRRRSVRKYSEEALSAWELSFLLWCAQGVRQIRPAHTLRTVPSAGARHALETYVLVNRAEGFAPGLYRYAADRHGLLAVNLSGDIPETVTQACLDQRMVFQSAASFVWAAEAYRMTYRYGERGYRYLHLDAGHACQNLYLAAEAIGCGVCAIAAFDDDALNRALGLDGTERFAVYAASLGKPER